MLFSASLSVVESPLRGLFSGRNSCVYISDRMYVRFKLGPHRVSKLAGNKVVVAIHEATLFLRLDSNGSPRWMNLLEVTACCNKLLRPLTWPFTDCQVHLCQGSCGLAGCRCCEGC